MNKRKIGLNHAFPFLKGIRVCLCVWVNMHPSACRLAITFLFMAVVLMDTESILSGKQAWDGLD